jgi:alkylhydroperoxidase/carboxymuconolactone decarboxylase family protein YurZ
MNKEELLAKIKSTRGYVLPMHTMLAEYHPEYLDTYDDWFNSVMNEQSPLPRKVREFVMIAVCLSINSAENVIQGHMKRAIEHGASVEELLAVVELTVSSHAAKPLAAGTRGIQALLDEKKKS